ncbi:unnamed protein product, partial [Trypanosoma congolense IL3000]
MMCIVLYEAIELNSLPPGEWLTFRAASSAPARWGALSSKIEPAARAPCTCEEKIEEFLMVDVLLRSTSLDPKSVTRPTFAAMRRVTSLQNVRLQEPELPCGSAMRQRSQKDMSSFCRCA